MTNDKKVVPNENDGFIESIANYLKLVYRLMLDNRVNAGFKAIPLLSLVYLINPFDIPFPIDDAAVIWGLTYLFIEFCPQDVVAEHRAAISAEIFAKWVDKKNNPADDEEVIIDAEYRE